MAVAVLYSELSYCNRRKVGAVLVSKDNRILCCGYNGNTAGTTNDCEGQDGLTLETVHHAEMNLIGYCAKYGISTLDTTMYVTLAPCINCAKAIEISGISKVIYLEEYGNKQEGLLYLKNRGILVEKFK